MKCPFRKKKTTDYLSNQYNVITSSLETEEFEECLKHECPAYYPMGSINCALIEHRIRKL